MVRTRIWMAGLLSGIACAARAQVAVTTWHNDLARTGANTRETVLTPAVLRAGRFGKLCAYAVDGQVYAQPLYVPGVTIAGVTRNVVYVATEHDSVYALDASCATAAPLWRVSFLAAGDTTMPCISNNQPQCDVTIMSPEHGITPTPVIDVTAGTIFVAAQSVEAGAYTQKLHALSLATGAERAGSPVVIAGHAPGHPQTVFDPQQAFQRAGLLLADGVVHVPFASNDSANGWIFSYHAASLALRSVFCVTATGQLGGIWGGGAAPALDSAGMLYAATGNGTLDAPSGGADYAMSVLRISPGGGALTVADYFAPANQAALSRRDLDLDSGGLMLLPDQAGPHAHEAVIGFKTGLTFVLDRDHLGGIGPEHAVQRFVGNKGGIYSSFAYWNGSAYLAGVGGKLTQWTLAGGRFPPAPTHVSGNVYNYPGATPSISANGASDGIVWTIQTPGMVRGGGAAVLYAHDAADVSTELWDSAMAGKRDRAGPGVKFSVPTVADGRVFVGTQTEVDVYGTVP